MINFFFLDHLQGGLSLAHSDKKHLHAAFISSASILHSSDLELFYHHDSFMHTRELKNKNKKGYFACALKNA